MVVRQVSSALAVLASALLTACSTSGSILAPPEPAPPAADAAPPPPSEAGVASLTELDVAPLTIVPPFSPAVHDYYVQCASGTNSLTVSMEASPGAKGLLLEPILSPSATKQTLTLGVLENQAIVAAATDGASTNEYWIRCLPHDFSGIQMVAHPEAGTVTPGYYLVGDEKSDRLWVL